MDRKLLDLLCSPDTRQPLSLLDATGLDALNRAIGSGAVLKADGGAVEVPLDAFGKDSKGLLIGMPKADFDRLVAQATQH
jgi:uncharacterized protein YbaR (Trm112 family)